MSENTLITLQEDDSKQHYCRICLNKTLISDCKLVTSLLNSRQSIRETIEELAQIQISETDGYSQLVCIKCLEKLTSAIEIKHQIKEADTKLRNQLIPTPGLPENVDMKTDIKDENPDLSDVIKQEEIDISDDDEEMLPDPIEATLEKVKVQQLRGVKCPECLKIFRTLASIKAHSTVHNSIKAFKCKFCKERFLYKYECEKHEINHKYTVRSKQNVDCSENDNDKVNCTPSQSSQEDCFNIIKEDSLFPERSATKYLKYYETFMTWCENQQIKEYTEDVFCNYFTEKSKTFKVSTLWNIYSILKSTFCAKHNVDMSKYQKLTEFLKSQNVGYTPKKSNIFTRDQIMKFLKNAPDLHCLLWKVCLIFGVAGGCRMSELKKIKLDNVKDKGNSLEITTVDSMSNKRFTFSITNKKYENIDLIGFYRKYLSLRPSHIDHKWLFLYYRSGRCTSQAVGIHTFRKMPKLIATCLNLENANEYTGNAFRRTSSSLLADTNSDLLSLKQHTLKKQEFG